MAHKSGQPVVSYLPAQHVVEAAIKRALKRGPLRDAHPQLTFHRLNSIRKGSAGRDSTRYKFSFPSTKESSGIAEATVAIQLLKEVYASHGFPDIRTPEFPAEQIKVEVLTALEEIYGPRNAIDLLKRDVGLLATFDALLSLLNSGSNSMYPEASGLSSETYASIRNQKLSSADLLIAGKLICEFKIYCAEKRGEESALNAAADFLRYLAGEQGAASHGHIRLHATVLERLGLYYKIKAIEAHQKADDKKSGHSRDAAIGFYATAVEYYGKAGAALREASKLYQSVEELSGEVRVLKHEADIERPLDACTLALEFLKKQKGIFEESRQRTSRRLGLKS